MSCRDPFHGMKPGEMREVAGKLYGLCADCYSLIRMDKPILGSIHFCVPDD